MQLPEAAGLSKSAVIARAKREWQCIVDALPQLVCLLNRNGRVARSNRVAEHWRLCRVNEVAGLHMHELLHGACNAAECRLLSLLQQSWCTLSNETDLVEFDLHDALLQRWLKVTFKLMPAPVDPADLYANANTTSRAVCIVEDITSLRQAEEGQRILNQHLETRVAARTQELSVAVGGLKAEAQRREAAETSLLASRNELSLLSGQLMKAQESERKRIAQDLHDTVGQSLSAIKYSLERAQQMIASVNLGDPIAVLGKTVGLVQRTIDDVRTISENLRPAVLDSLGAVSAIRWLCREWGEVFTKIEVEINLHVTDADIDEPLGTTLFRTVQESLNNVARHSEATLVKVSVSREAHRLRLDICDNGVGFEPQGETLRHGHGLRGIRERVSAAGGEFLLTSYPGGGVHLAVSWPIPSVSESVGPLLCAV
jgi:signal transduction histidine kinase